MAEAALFSLAAKLLSTIAAPPFKKAYKRARSIRGARGELEDLRDTITTIQAVLLDAEKQQKDSVRVKNWVKRVSDVLHDAEDLFDEVATDDMLKQQMKGNKYLKKVRVFGSKLNPITSNDSISKKVKAIRKDLGKISSDMALFSFVIRAEDAKPISGLRRGAETGGFVGQAEVIGRDDEKERVVNFLCDKAYVEENVALISIVGIGGMGKSALAQLVCNNGKIKNDFQNRYWACISDILDEKVVTGKIFQSITKRNYQGLDLHQLQSGIRESIDHEGRFLLVLDDFWDEDNARGRKLRSLLSSDVAKGSKIIITTRYSSVAKAMNADEILELKGLSIEASWELFRRFAFTKEQENDPAWISLGKKIVKKCANVPLAIKSIASLLSKKDTMGEWRTIENEELSKIQLDEDPIMSTLRLSYDHLPSHLKNCFAYCSLYEKGENLCKRDLIVLWIAQGYVKTNKDETLETAGHAYFMELFRRCFFQDATYDSCGEIRVCRMHDLVHELALDVAGEESITVTDRSSLSHKNFRHINVACEIDESWSLPQLVLKADRLRSYICWFGNSFSTRLFKQQVPKFKFLRVLILSELHIEEVPSSIGELIYLRCLDLSWNKYTRLPDSITKLVNLFTLDINNCKNLVELPKHIGKLISLRHLINDECEGLREMPVSFGKLGSLQHLSELRVSKSGGLDVLTALNLQGRLKIKYDEEVGGCSKGDFVLKNGQISHTLEMLRIEEYPSMRMPAWWREDPASRLPMLECLELSKCKHVVHLPPLRCLPCLRILRLEWLDDLEHMEEEGEEVVSTTPFYPSLRELWLSSMPKLKGWSKPVNAAAAATTRIRAATEEHSVIKPDQPLFSLLQRLYIKSTPCLVSMPPTPHLQSLELFECHTDIVKQLLSTSSPSTSSPSSSLQDIEIWHCDNLTSFAGEGLTSLRKVDIACCPELTNVKVAPGAVEEFCISGCPKVELWAEERKEEERSIHWQSFQNLRSLTIEEIPEEGRLPHCLQHLVALGKLQISDVRSAD